MAANQFKEEQLCRKDIDEKLRKVMKGKINFIDYKNLIRECLITYAVSRRSIESFIQDFFIDTKDLILEEGTLKRGLTK